MSTVGSAGVTCKTRKYPLVKLVFRKIAHSLHSEHGYNEANQLNGATYTDPPDLTSSNASEAQLYPDVENIVGVT